LKVRSTLFWDRVLLCSLELVILLPQPLNCWDYKHGPPGTSGKYRRILVSLLAAREASIINTLL
jgi:hypothetical protein